MKKVIIIGAVIIVGAMVASYRFSGLLPKISPSEKTSQTSNISQEEAAKKIKTFVEENLVDPGTEINVKDVTQESDLYKATVTIKGKDYVMYLTLDGKKFFPQGMDTNGSDKKKEVAKEIPKSDKPEVNLYVMSFCPYGNKAEDTLKSVYGLLKDKVNFNFYYIVGTSEDDIQSLHGPKEVAENEREACVLKEYGKDKWMDFVTYVNANCGSDGSCWETGAKNVAIDSSKINTCVSSEGAALMKTNEQDSNTAGADGSPTMTINGVLTEAVYQYGNSDVYKQVICSAFNNPPSECNETLSSQTATSQGGSCGS